MRKLIALFLVSFSFFISTESFPVRPLFSQLGLAQSQRQQDSNINAVSSIGMTVANMNKSVDFYSKTLNFRKVFDIIVSGNEQDQIDGLSRVKKRIVVMQLGQELIELTEYITPKGRPIPSNSRSNDLWFQHIAIVVKDIDQAYQILRQNKVQHVSTAPQTLPKSIPAAAGIKAFYFRDPDGHNLEIISFPPDKGEQRWQIPTDELFLGIDHTAIAVADTDQSLRFYRDILGLRVVGKSENLGTEQEHLNGVFGARLLITALKTDQGPGVEFLQYLAPPGGRPAPEDIKTNDISHWQTTLVRNDIKMIEQNLKKAKVAFISSGIVSVSNNQLGFTKVLLVRDPDGHAVRIVLP